MRILTRYILGEILSNTLIGCALFTFILFMPYLSNILDMVVRNSSTFTDAAEIILFTLPNILTMTIPMAVLVGLLLGLSRLAADSEIIAMRASGLGIGYFVRVASIVAIAGTLIGLANSLYIAPRAAQGILDMEQELETSQASYQIQPRVFHEDFKNFVLYVQNVRSGTGASNWDQVFMADVTDPTAPRITTAASATVVGDSTQVLLMRLRNGAQHDTVLDQPDQYNISAFTTTDRPLELGGQNDVHLGRRDTAVHALPLGALIERAKGPDARRFQIELHNRFALPAACLVLMLVGVPLGVASRRGGKSSGFVYTILLVFLYYFLTVIGTALGRQNKVPVFLAVWSANILFTAVGIFLLWQMASGGRVLSAISAWFRRGSQVTKTTRSRRNGVSLTGFLERFPVLPRQSKPRNTFPRILDEYVVREFLNTFLLVLSGFVLLMLVSTFFDLVGDILRNKIPLVTVGAYLVNLIPYMLYTITPLAVLIAVLVTFGVLNRNSEIIAMKATGISLYRLVIPIVSIAAVLSIGLFLVRSVLSAASQPQAGGVAQHHQRQARRKRSLIPSTTGSSEQPRPGEPGRIFYYEFYDPDRMEFANLSVFEFDPSTFSLTRRIFAARVYRDKHDDAWQLPGRLGARHERRRDHQLSRVQANRIL